jgi:hypothetical protein
VGRQCHRFLDPAGHSGGRIAHGDRRLHRLIEMKSRAAGKARTAGAF